MRRLLDMDVTNLTAIGDANPHIKEVIVSVIESRGTDSEAEIDSAIVNTDAPNPARRAGIELIIGIGTRMESKCVQFLY
jgi:hypothetical protein